MEERCGRTRPQEAEQEPGHRAEEQEMARMQQHAERQGQAGGREAAAGRQGEEAVEDPDRREDRHAVVAALTHVQEERYREEQGSGGDGSGSLVAYAPAGET